MVTDVLTVSPILATWLREQFLLSVLIMLVLELVASNIPSGTTTAQTVSEPKSSSPHAGTVLTSTLLITNLTLLTPIVWTAESAPRLTPYDSFLSFTRSSGRQKSLLISGITPTNIHSSCRMVIQPVGLLTIGFRQLLIFYTRLWLPRRFVRMLTTC